VGLRVGVNVGAALIGIIEASSTLPPFTLEKVKTIEALVAVNTYVYRT
jgi:hypothetical protein